MTTARNRVIDGSGYNAGSSIAVFSDNFDRANTYAVGTLGESSDGNDWLLSRGNADSGGGISSNKLSLSTNANASAGATYRRSLENYSIISPSYEVIFYWVPATKGGAGAIGWNIMSDSTDYTSALQNNGIAIYYYSNTELVYLGNNGSTLTNASFTPIESSEYIVKVLYSPSNVKIKIWASSGSEPSAWLIDNNSTYVSQGNYFCFWNANYTAGSGSGHTIDTLTINKVES